MSESIAARLPQTWQFQDRCFLYRPGPWGGKYLSAPFTVQVGARRVTCCTLLLPAEPYFLSTPVDLNDPGADEAGDDLHHRDMVGDTALAHSEEHREFLATYRVCRTLAVYAAYLDKGPTPLAHDLLRRALCGLIVARMAGVHRATGDALLRTWTGEADELRNVVHALHT